MTNCQVQNRFQRSLVWQLTSRGTLNNVRYLSDEWITKADAQIKGQPPLSSNLVIRYEVSGGPEGDRIYHLVLGPEKMAVSLEHPAPSVTFTLPWECATAIATGSMSAQRAFLDGTMSLSGDAATLIGHQATFGAVMDSLAELRDQTEYV